MPHQRIRLPDGTVMDVPHDATEEEKSRIASSLWRKYGSSLLPSRQRQQPSRYGGISTLSPLAFQGMPVPLGLRRPYGGEPPPPRREEGEQEEGTFLGSLGEAAKALLTLRGTRQFARMAQQGILGLATPDKDTPKEREVRAKLQAIAEEIDPRYRDANLPMVATGLGQVAGMIGTSLIPYVGPAAAFTGVGLMGAGEQAGRIADYEKRTGKDVSKAKEIMALAGGLGIGLTEMIPVSKFGFGKITETVGKRADWGPGQVIGSVFKQAKEEAIQEGLAGFGQSALARYLYDEDALADAGVEAMQEALIGGEVGAVVDVIASIASRRFARYRAPRTEELKAEKVLSESQTQAQVDGKYIPPEIGGVADPSEGQKEIEAGEDSGELKGEELERRKVAQKEIVDLHRSALEVDEETGKTEVEVNAEVKFAEQEEQIDRALDEKTIDEKAAEVLRARLAEDRKTFIKNIEGFRQDAATIENLKIDAEEQAKIKEEEDSKVLTRGDVVRELNRGNARIRKLVLDFNQLRNLAIERDTEGKIAPDDLQVLTAADVPHVPTELFEERTELEQEVKKLKKHADQATMSDIRAKRLGVLKEKKGELARKNEDIAKAVEEGWKALEEGVTPIDESTETEIPTVAWSAMKKLLDRYSSVANEMDQPELVAAAMEIQTEITQLEADRTSNEELLGRVEAAEAPTEEESPTIEALDPSPVYSQASILEQILLRLRVSEVDERKRIEVAQVEQAKVFERQAAEKRAALSSQQEKLSELEKVEPISAEKAARLENRRAEKVKEIEAIEEPIRDKFNVENAKDAEIPVDEKGNPLEEYTVQDQTDLQKSQKAVRALQKDLQAYNRQLLNTRSPEGLEKRKEAARGRVAARQEVVDRLEGDTVEVGLDGTLISGLRTVISPEYQRQQVREDLNNWKNTRESPETLKQRLVTQQQREALDALVADNRAKPDRQLTSAETTTLIETILSGIHATGGLQGTWLPGVLRGDPARRIGKKGKAGPPTEGRAVTDYTERQALKNKTIQNDKRVGILQTVAAIRAVLGFDSIVAIDRAIEAIALDKPAPPGWSPESLGRLGDGDVMDVIRTLQKNRYNITEKILVKLLEAKNFKIEKGTLFRTEFFGQLMGDTLGVSVFTRKSGEGKKAWDRLNQGQKEAVFARILRTNPREDTTEKGRREVIYKRELRRAQNKSLLVKSALERRADVDSLAEVQDRVAKFREAAKRILRKMGYGDVDVLFTIDADTNSLLGQVEDVVVNGTLEVETDENGNAVLDENGKNVFKKDEKGKPIHRPAYRDGAVASLQNYGNQIVFNLSQIVGKYENGIETDPEILIKDATVHEMAHLHFVRNRMKASEATAFERFGKSRNVPKKVSLDASQRGLTWREYVSEIYPELEGQALTEETTAHILDALAQGKIPKKQSKGTIGKVKRELEVMFKTIVGASHASDLHSITSIFETLQNEKIMKRRQEEGITEGDESLRLLKRASPLDQKRLLDAIKEGDQDKIHEIADEIVVSRYNLETKDPREALLEVLVNELRSRKLIDDTPEQVTPVLNAQSIQSGDISPEAIAAFWKFYDTREPPFRFHTPEDMRLFRFGGSSVAINSEDAELSARLEEAGVVSRSKPPGQQVLEAAEIHNMMEDGGFVGDTADFKKMLEGHVRATFRQKFLDKRLPMWLASKRANNRAIKLFDKALYMLAETSAIAAWRVADNAMTFMSGVNEHGMIIYADGGFRVRELKSADGKRDVKGLAVLSKPIVALGQEAQNIATAYLAALRIRAVLGKVKEGRELVTALTIDVDPGGRILNPEALFKAKTELARWEHIYLRTHPPTKAKDDYGNIIRQPPMEELDNVIAEVEKGETDIQKAVLKFSQEYSDFNHWLIQFSLDTGMLTKDKAELMQSMPFIPFYRDLGFEKSVPMENMHSEEAERTRTEGSEAEREFRIEPGETEITKDRDGVTLRGKPLIDYSIAGSFLPIKSDLFGSLTRNTQALIRDGMWNVAGGRTMRDEVANGTGVEIPTISVNDNIEFKNLHGILRGYSINSKDLKPGMTQDQLTGLIEDKKDRPYQEHEIIAMRRYVELQAKMAQIREKAKVINEQLDKRNFGETKVYVKGVTTSLDTRNFDAIRTRLAAEEGVPEAEITKAQLMRAVPQEGEFIIQERSDIIDSGELKAYRVQDPQLSLSMMQIGFSPSQAIESFFTKSFGESTAAHRWFNKNMSKLLIGSSSALRELVTRAPPFMAKNIIRDALQASVTFGGGVPMMLKIIRNVFDTDLQRRANMEGLGIAIDWTPDPALAGQNFEKMVKDLSWANPLDIAVIAWNGLGRLSKQSELATRMAVFDTVMERTSEDGPNSGNAAQAFLEATEIINYGRRGSNQLFSVLTAMAPFMNGRIQGLDVMYRTHIGALDAPGRFEEEGTDLDSWTIRRQRIQTAFNRGAFLMGLTAIYWFMVKDDEEYKNAREDMKNDWWLIPLGGGLPGIKIPIPFEVGVLYKVIPEQILRAISEEEHDFRDVRNETFRQLRSSLALDLRPQLIRPILDGMMNRDIFQNDKIVPQWMDNSVASTEQFTPYTSHVVKKLTEVMDTIPLVKNMDFLTSPMKLEYMMRQYAGTIGAYGMALADLGYRHIEDENVVGTAADWGPSSWFDSRTFSNIPMLGDLFYDPERGGGYQEDLYELTEDMEKLITTLGQLEERNDRGAAAREYEEENKPMFQNKRRLAYLKRRMDHWRRERDALFQRPDLSDEDKRNMLYRMFENRDDMLAEIVNVMSDVREDRGILEELLGTRI